MVMSSTTLRRLIIMALIVLWEVLPRIGAIPELFLPSLSSTLQAGWSDAGEYGHALVVTLYEVAVASVYGFLPTMLATAAGIQTIDPQLLLAARSMGATLPQRITRVIIPAAIPTVLSGLRVGGALVIVGVVVSEMLISSAGIGYLISRYRTILESAHVFAGVLLVLVMAVAFNALIKFVERRAAVWQTGTRAGRDTIAREIPAAALQPTNS